MFIFLYFLKRDFKDINDNLVEDQVGDQYLYFFDNNEADEL